MAASANKVVFGLSNVHVAFLNETTGVYGTPIAIPGAVNLSLSPEGASSEFYADNIKYFTADSNQGYSGDLECAMMPDDVLKTMLGWEIDVHGALVEVADGVQAPFALLFEVEGNVAQKRYAYYRCIASRPTEEHGTKADSIEPNTQTVTLTITPTTIDSVLIVKAGIELSSAPDAWAATTAYALGAECTGGGNVYTCTTAGTSGATAPTWPASGTVQDGATLVWTYKSASNATVYNAWYTAVTKPTYVAA